MNKTINPMTVRAATSVNGPVLSTATLMAPKADPQMMDSNSNMAKSISLGRIKSWLIKAPYIS
jgi:hypothetical protein